MTNSSESRSTQVMTRALRWSVLIAVAIALVGAIVGQLVAGSHGATSAFIGAGIGLVFLGLTTVSILVGARFSASAFFGIVMGVWLLKLVLLVVALLVLRDQGFIVGSVLFWTLVSVTLVTLTVDVISVVTGRIPYVDAADTPRDNPSSAGESGERDGSDRL